MIQTTYENLAKELAAEAFDIMSAKRPDYTVGNVDVLHNFKQAALRAGITPEQAWIIYTSKHWDSICSIMQAKRGATFSEPPIGRFADALNYLYIGYALYREREDGEV